MSNATTKQKTPGYNCHLHIAFSADKNGKRIAYHWGPGRWIKMGLLAAELFVAQAQATEVPYINIRKP